MADENGSRPSFRQRVGSVRDENKAQVESWLSSNTGLVFTVLIVAALIVGAVISSWPS